MENRIFMGYASVDALLEGRNSFLTTLYLFSGVREHRSQYASFRHRTYYLFLSLIDGSAVHYCQIDAGSAQVVADHTGQPVAESQRDTERIEHRVDSLERCLKSYLSRRGFCSPRQAMPTLPREMNIVAGGGWQQFARLNADATEFVESEVQG